MMCFFACLSFPGLLASAAINHGFNIGLTDDDILTPNIVNNTWPLRQIRHSEKASSKNNKKIHRHP
jgi:hypothetical protein